MSQSTGTDAEARSFFSGYMQGGKIYSQTYEGVRCIGVTAATYNALSEEHNSLVASYNEYQQMLIDLGKIKVPMTQDQLIEKQTELLNKHSEQIGQLQSAIADLITYMQNGAQHHESVDSIQDSSEPLSEGGGDRPRGKRGVSNGAGNRQRPEQLAGKNG